MKQDSLDLTKKAKKNHYNVFDKRGKVEGILQS